MRRLVVVLVLPLLAVLGCHKDGPSAVADDAKSNIQALNDATDQQDIDDAAQAVYAVGPLGIPAMNDALGDRTFKHRDELVAEMAQIPDAQIPMIFAAHLKGRISEDHAPFLAGMARFLQAPVDDVIPLLDRQSDRDREWAMYMLARSGKPFVRPYLLNGLLDSSDYTRIQAARGLRYFPGPDTVNRLVPLLDAKDQTLSGEALISLAWVAPNHPLVKSKLAAIGDRATNSDTEARRMIAFFLGESKDPVAEKYLAKSISDPDPRVRSAAAAAYGRMGAVRDPKPLLHAFASDIDMNVRQSAGESVVKLDLDDAAPVAKQMIEGSDPRLQKLGTTTLVRLGGLKALGALIVLQRTGKLAEARLAGEIGLTNRAQIGAKPFHDVDVLLQQTRERDIGKRIEAINLLGYLQGPRYYVALQQLMSDSNSKVRVAAMDAFKRQMGLPLSPQLIQDHPLPSWLDFDHAGSVGHVGS